MMNQFQIYFMMSTYIVGSVEVTYCLLECLPMYKVSNERVIKHFRKSHDSVGRVVVTYTKKLKVKRLMNFKYLHTDCMYRTVLSVEV